MYAPERQQALVAQARRDGRISAVEAAPAFGVTAETIRRDLAVLDRLGVLRRVHGGAVPSESLRPGESSLSDRSVSRSAEKARIARAERVVHEHHAGPRAGPVGGGHGDGDVAGVGCSGHAGPLPRRRVT